MAPTSRNHLALCFLFIICGVVLTVSEHPDNKKDSSICQANCSLPMNGTETQKNCTSAGLQLYDRCCMNTTNGNIIGIDLEQCNLTREEFVKGIHHLWHLEVISLQGNPIISLNVSDFHNNTGIKYLSLPPKVACPGSSRAWQQEENLESATVCLGEVDICKAVNVSCPVNSHCSLAGVDSTYCLCDEGFKGYKCMDKGDFPFMIFGIGITAPTIVLCILLWVSQRRYVKSKPKAL